MINKLVANIKKTNAPIVVGLDPMLDYVPDQVKAKAFTCSGSYKGEDSFSDCDPGCQIRCDRGNCSWNRTCDRRDYGGHHGCRKPAENATRASERCAYNDDKHCNGDGLCGGSAQRSADCDCGGTVCIYFDYQWMCIRFEQEEQK